MHRNRQGWSGRLRAGARAAGAVLISTWSLSAGVAQATTPPPVGSGATDAGEPVSGGQLTVAVEAEPTGWNPLTDPCNEACSAVRNAFFEPLVDYDAGGAVKPFVAESITPNQDGSEWTLTLRAGVTFSNGAAVTAQAISDLFTMLRGEGSLVASRLAGLSEVVVSDPLTVTFKLAGPDTGFADQLTTIPVFDPTAAAADPGAFSSSPVGTGPFVVSSWDRGSQLVASRNSSYWRKSASGVSLPYLDGITFRFIPDEDARLASLEAGDVDVIQTLRESTVRRAGEVTGVVVESFQGNQSTGGVFNTAKAPTDDLRVRKGLTALLDQAALIDVLGGAGISEPATQHFARSSPFWSQAAADNYTISDTERGTAWLKEYIDDPARSDGKDPGSPIQVEFNCLPDPSLTEMSQAIQALWQQTGQVEVKLNTLESAAHIAAVVGSDPDYAGSFQVACWRNGSQADPSTVQTNYSATAGNPANFHNEVDEDILSWFEAAKRETDRATRAGYFQRIFARVDERAYFYYLGHTVSALVRSPRVSALDAWTLPDGSAGYGHPNAVAKWQEAWVSG